MKSNILPIVFLPGIGVTCKELESQRVFLEIKGIKVVCLDWPAFDKTHFNFSHHADWVVGQLDKLKIKKAGFFGQSRGGLALIKIAAKYPEKVAFAIINSAPAGKGPASVSKTFHMWLRLMYSLPKSLLLAGINLASRISRDPYIPFLQANDPKELLGCYLDHMQSDWSDDVKNITVPTIFRYGLQDRWVKRAGNHAVTSLSKNIVLDPASGHGPPKPEVLWQLVQSVLK